MNFAHRYIIFGYLVGNLVTIANAQLIEEIQVVETSPLEHTVLESVHPVSIIEGDELRSKTEQNIGETLANELGVHADSFGPGAARPTIRGFDRRRIKITENGIDTMDASTVSADHAVGIEAGSATRIEIIRGPGTLAFGSNAVGGVVNIIDSRLPTDVDESLTGFASARFGSNAQEQAYLFDTSGSVGDYGWHIDGAHREAGDMEIPGFANIDHEIDGDPGPEGIVENSSYETDSAAGGVAWTTDAVEMGLSISRLETNYGIAGNVEEEEDVRIDLQQTRYDLLIAATNPINFVENLKLRVGVNNYEHRELEGDETGTVFVNDEVEARLDLLHGEAFGIEGAVGILYGDRDFSAVGEEAFVPPNRTKRVAAYWIGSEKISDALTLEGGLRFENQDITTSDGQSSNHNAVSISLGTAWEISSGRFLTANIQRAQRNPTPEELYSNGVHIATNSFEFGNPALDTETDVALDIGFRGYGNRLDWESYVFYNDYKDFVVLSPTDKEEDGFGVFKYEQVNAKIYGFEAALSASITESASSSVGWRVFTDYTRARLKGGGNLPRIPPFRLGAEFDASYGPWRIAGDVVYNAKQANVAESETETDAYTTLGFDVSYRIMSGSLEWNLFLLGRNITDQVGRRHQSRLKDLVPIRGRNFMIGVRADF